MFHEHDFSAEQCILCKQKGLSFHHNIRDDNTRWAAICDFCGHVQIAPLPTPEEEHALYSKVAYRNSVDLSDEQIMNKLLPFAEREVAKVVNLIPSNKKIFEIGSGFGWVIEKLRNLGYEIDGCEFNEQERLWAKKRANIDLLDLDATTDSGANDILFNKYDVVCSFFVLEHMLDPEDFIRKSLRYLKKSGSVLFAVPNFNEYCKSICNEYHDFSFVRQHISYFHPNALKLLLERSGLTNIRISGDHPYSIENALHWAKVGAPFTSYYQFEVNEALKFVDAYYKTTLENDLTSYALYASADYNDF